MTHVVKKPQLLAPAGDIDSFHAAIDAGADAVYIGLTDFNARMRARNFTTKTLSFLLPYAHARRKKIYVTMNTLVKQAELAQCIHTLYQLDQIGVDGIIVQDFGIVDLCKRAFPRLKLHASTQMSIHNSLGVAAAKHLGINRVVLARELTLDELARIRQKSDIELEVFVHGALCYCFSGMCLASSFLGGSSGNRGRCTQVCRRPFQAREGGRRGHFFSPADFCAMKRIDKVMDIGVDSLKIEGRMKNEEYVFSVVSAYRKVIDDPTAAADLSTNIDSDLGRKKSGFFLDGVQKDGIIDPVGPSGTGVVIGAIEKREGANITVVAEQAVSKGDFVRIQPKSGFEGATFRVTQSTMDNGRCVIALAGNVEAAIGDMVYLVRHGDKAYRNNHRRAIVQKPAPYNPIYPKVNDLMSMYAPRPERMRIKAKSELFIVIDDPQWLHLIDSPKIDAVVTALGQKDMRKYLIDGNSAEAWKEKDVVGFPHFIPEADLEFWKSACAALLRKGIRRALCHNLGQWTLFDPPVTAYSSAWLWCFNRAAQKALIKTGIRQFTYSLEDDFPNMQRSASRQGMVCLFSYVPLFISRINPGLPIGEKCRDASRNEFFTAEKDGVYYLVAQKPLCLFQKKRKLEEAGINSFIIDMSFCKPNKRLLEDLLRNYEQGTKVEGSGMFNFKLGIK
jgi:U32 family peptidase